MLDFKEKIQFFASILNGREVSYADSFNADLDIAGMNYDYSFLKRLNSGKVYFKIRIIYFINSY